MPGAVEVHLSDDGQHWRSVAKLDDGTLLPDGPLTLEESQRVKTWIDLNCPLWPDYINRPERRVLAQGTANQPPK
jgi:hypothetical protein